MIRRQPPRVSMPDLAALFDRIAASVHVPEWLKSMPSDFDHDGTLK